MSVSVDPFAEVYRMDHDLMEIEVSRPSLTVTVGEQSITLTVREARRLAQALQAELRSL